MPESLKKMKRDVVKEYDINDDGTLTEEELDMLERIVKLKSKQAMEKDRDQREDAQRKMAWISLYGMIGYPLLIVLAYSLGLPDAAEILSSTANIYFVSVAAIVAAFFGSQAYQNSNIFSSDDTFERRRR